MNKYRVTISADDDCTSEMIVNARTPMDAAGVAVKYERKRIRDEHISLKQVRVYGAGMKHVDRMADTFTKHGYAGSVCFD